MVKFSLPQFQKKKNTSSEGIKTGVAFVIVSVIGSLLIALSWVRTQAPHWQSIALSALAQGVSAGTDRDTWETIWAQAETLPNIYPMSKFKRIVRFPQTFFTSSQTISELDWPAFGEPVPTEYFRQILSEIHRTRNALGRLHRDIESLPLRLIPPEKHAQRDFVLTTLTHVREAFSQTVFIEDLFEHWVQNHSRVLILLQNTNEVRPTGGFTGSMLIIDFSPEFITYEFTDVYAYDRLVPDTALLTAPDFFSAVSSEISLRDANISRDFPTTARTYQHFFASMGETVPESVIALNLSLLRDLLLITGEITLPPWDVRLNSANSDLALSFLVESKVAGRYSAKQPVMQVLESLFVTLRSPTPEMIERAMAFDLKRYFREMNILAYSDNETLQRHFRRLGIEGVLRPDPMADNFLAVDFVSVGANKSDKFIWTKIHHDSQIHQEGKVLNTLNITRTHAIRPGEISELLGVENLPATVQTMLDETMYWKLGAGQNRVIARAYLPPDARMISMDSPSGTIERTYTSDGQFAIYEIPLYIKPQESITSTVVYETDIKRGSSNWRPYHMQVIGTPSPYHMKFIPSIRLADTSGTIREQTVNVGITSSLVSDDYRVVIEYPKID